MVGRRFKAWTLAAVLVGAGSPALAADEPAAAGAEASPEAEQREAIEREADERLRLDEGADEGASVLPLFNGDEQAGAAGRWGPNAQDFEFTLTGAASNDGRFRQGSVGVDSSLAWYATRAVSLELRQGISYQDLGGSSAWTGSTRGAVDYHFDFDRLRPFVGIVAGGFYGERIKDTGAAGLEGGLKFYVKPDTFLYGRVEHHWLFDTTDAADREFGSRRMLYTIGIGFNF